jgi:hypothetical protein
VNLPEGWQGVVFSKDGLGVLAVSLETKRPEIAEVLRGPASQQPFLPGTTYLAFDVDPDALEAYPTGFNVIEYELSPDLVCDTRILASSAADYSPDEPSVEYLDLPAGPASRVSFTWDAGDYEVFGQTYIVYGADRAAQAYFETRVDLRDVYEPRFEDIMQSFVFLPETPPSGATDTYQRPHDNPQLELEMPQTALGMPLCTWSISGKAAKAEPLLADVGADAIAQGAVLGVSVDSISIVVSGRAVAEDPPYIVTAVEYRGAAVSDLASSMAKWPIVTVAGRTLRVSDQPEIPGHAEGTTYLYLSDDTVWYVITDDPAWLADVVAQLP